MATNLGKRKRQRNASAEHDADDARDDEATRALFQRAFEKKFKALATKPLNTATKSSKVELEDESDSQESDWEGLSDESEDAVQIVDYTRSDEKTDDSAVVDRSLEKLFMSAKPPRSQDAPTKKAVKATKTEDDGAESMNLQNDLALQRLLKESHLLDSSASQRASFSTEGKGRIKALDMRLQDLGAKSSVLNQEKMPMAHRKGIISKSTQRQTTRRKEAAENGIILERFKSGTPKRPQARQRPRDVGGPGVGKFQRGMLKLSSRDVKDIVGSRSDKSGRRGGKKK